MKLDILDLRGLERSQEKAPELLPGRAAQPPAPPNFSHGVDAVVAAAGERGHAEPQGLALTEVVLDGRHPFGRQHLVEIGEQIGIRVCI